MNKQSDNVPDNRFCRLCNKLYTTSSSFRRHTKSRHADNLLNCKYCPKQYRRLDNLQQHLNKQHGETSHEIPRQLHGIPHNQSTDTNDLGTLYLEDRACSPINFQECTGYKSLKTVARDINKATKIKPQNTKLEGKLVTGKVVPSFRKERKWVKEEEVIRPTPTRAVDKDKINKILSAPKKPVTFPNSQLGTKMNTELFDRVTTKTTVFCPPVKKVKLNLRAGTQSHTVTKVITPNEFNDSQAVYTNYPTNKPSTTPEAPSNNNEFKPLDISSLNVDFNIPRAIPGTIADLEKREKIAPIPDFNPCETQSCIFTAPPQPSTSTSQRDERIKSNDCSVPKSSIFHDCFQAAKVELDELDQLIEGNHQLGLDLLISDSESESGAWTTDPDDLDLELFQ